MLLFFALVAWLAVATEQVTITWSHPQQPPKTLQETLSAVERHVLALEAAQWAGKQFGIEVKLCADPEFDPLIAEFTIPRMISYLDFYDHDCILGHDPSLKWWGDKDQPKERKKKTIVGSDLSFSSFLWKLRSKQAQEVNEVWQLDSDSIRSWFKGRLLYSTHRNENTFARLLMSQVNVMNGPDGEKDLKRMPQAVQGALVVVLPDYSSWGKVFDLKRDLFDPTWWRSRRVPSTDKELRRIIASARKNPSKLVVIVHEPTPAQFKLVENLNLALGKPVLSVHKILPKGFTTLTLLKFIQKAAQVLVDERDSLGRIMLLTRFDVERIRYGYGVVELAAIISASLWIGLVTAVLLFKTHQKYSNPLHRHLKRLFLGVVWAASPVVLFNPSLWPRRFIYFWYGVCDAGASWAFVVLVSFYSLALCVTAIVCLFNRKQSESEETTLLVPRNT